MVKRLVVFFSILCAAFVLCSCSDSLENKSSVSFSISETVFREVIGSDVSGDVSDSEQLKTYSVKVTVSWEKDQNRSKTETVSADSSGTISCPTFKFDDLPTGKTVKVEVSIYNGELLVYKTETPKEIELKPGENTCDLELTKCVADLVISIENKEEITLDETASYKLVAQLSGDYDFKSEILIANTDTTLPIENLSIGKTVNLDVSIYKDALCVYKMAKPKSITISETNEIAVTLENAISTAAVWQDCVTKELSGVSNYNFYQAKTFDVEKETSALIEKPNGDSSYNNNIIYTFDGDGNLWTALVETSDSGSVINFNKYVMDSRLYTTSGNKNYPVLVDSNQSVVDIYWDNSSLYALLSYNNSFYLNSYTLNVGEFVAGTPLEIKLPADETTSPSLTTLAVHGSKVFVASEKALAVYWNEISGDSFSFITFNNIDISSSFTYSVDYNTKMGIADLQFGDGLGGSADKLYALARTYTWNISTTSKEIYSDGALIEIDIDIDSFTFIPYGFKTNAAEPVVLQNTEDSTDMTISLFCPTDNSGNFFGPTKFVALVPKKLVILDDGISISDKKIKNNDSLFEFDIAEKTITKGVSVSASIPEVGSVAAEWKN